MTPQPDSIAPLREAFTSLSQGAIHREDCPASGSIWGAAQGQATAREVRDVVDHTAHCAACAEAWRLAVEIGHGVMEEETAQPMYGALGNKRRLLAPLAAVLVLGLLGFQVRQYLVSPPPPPAVERSGETVGIRSLVPDQPLSRLDCRLAWSSQEDVLHYDLLVTTEELDTVARVQRLGSAEHRIPPADLMKLPPGTRLVWRVEAVLGNGERLASPTFVSPLE